ncbi:P2X purinoceptor 4 [Fasciolopsis buskii]|uniref:P2X purinoceptor 4 n=1 Tax=Fasciolopsis buskii TaxID=27845 RepID=A0A8E0VHZ4_9TREM|nr:P2X purinoceptor 4 [Fasciolopsis buski]
MLQYEMPKVVVVQHRTVASLNRILQVIIVLYFFIFAMWWEKAYQRFDEALSGVRFEVNGMVTSRIRGVDKNSDILLDSADYFLVPNEVNGFFLITRLIAVTVQKHGQCAEARDVEDARCFDDRHCKPGYIGGQTLLSPTRELPPNWVIDTEADAHGIFTGRCVKHMETCEIYGWCPVQEDLDTLHAGVYKKRRKFWHPEDDAKETGSDVFEPLYGVLNLTITIQNMIEFPLFNISRYNLLSWMTEEYLRHCIYRPADRLDRYCPNFRIRDILLYAGANTYKVMRRGGVIAITIDWKCNLDFSLKHCRPRYGFLHLDAQDSDVLDELGPGEGSLIDVARRLGSSLPIGSGKVEQRRLLYKVNGIQFLIRVTGEAGKFNLFIFTMNFGSNLALMSLAAFICDFILFHCTRKRKLYVKATRNIFLETKAALAYTPIIILDSISRKEEPSVLD